MTLNLSQFLSMTPKAQETKESNKLDFIKMKNFCASKDSIKNSEKTTNRMCKTICKSYKGLKFR